MTVDPGFEDLTPLPCSDDRPTFGYTPVDPLADPVVTIVTPFFDAGAHFRDTAVSVQRQTMQQWEWLVVNDGSTDAMSLDVLEEFRRSDPRIHVVDLDENGGPGAARNAGIAEASADYVVFLDSDDLLEPTMVEKLVWFLESRPDHAFAQGHTVGFGAESYVWASGFHEGERFLDGNRAGVTAIIRTSVLREVGGFDAQNRDGLEDWDLWLKCASRGYWGGTVPEPLSWYRRRTDHGDRWGNWDGGSREAAFHTVMKERHPVLWEGSFPRIDGSDESRYEPIVDSLPFRNDLVKDRPHLMMILPWMAVGGADKFNVDLIREMVYRGWSVTVATTLESENLWEHQFAKHTPDVFAMHRFLRTVDYPRFLRYLIASRTPDVVLVSNSELGYELLAYLRAHCPDPTYMDLTHAEQEDWKSGGHANFSNVYRHQLDLSVVVSEHLRSWMIDRGGDSSRIAVSHLGVDVERWKPDEEDRRRVRAELGIEPDTPLILFAGRLAEEKQPGVFADALRRLADDGREFAVVVAGDGPERGRFESFVAHNGLGERVLFFGYVSTDRMIELLRAAEIFFLPSKREGIALSIYEAMACGAVVVAADVGGQSELVGPDTGVLVTPGTPDREAAAYADALGSLIADPQGRHRMAGAARMRIVDGFTISAMVERFVAFIDHATTLHEIDPRSRVSVDAAAALATLAVEYQRTDQELDSRRSTAIDPGKGRAGRPDDDREQSGVSAPSGRAYAAAMSVFGGSYRAIKRRYPDRAVQWRDRARTLLRYRR